MLAAILLSFGVVFLAELGDRSQLIVMTCALRYRWWVVLSGVLIAACLVQGLSVAVGYYLGATIPARAMAFASAIAFLAFAGWAWRESAVKRDEDVSAIREPRLALLTVISTFVLAELSDKTTLATVTLASDRSWIGVWFGSTLGLLLADGLAIGAGTLLTQRLPERLLHTAAGVLFLLFGLWMLFDSALGWRSVAITTTAGTALVAVMVSVMHILRRPPAGAVTTSPAANRIAANEALSA